MLLFIMFYLNNTYFLYLIIIFSNKFHLKKISSFEFLSQKIKKKIFMQKLDI